MSTTSITTHTIPLTRSDVLSPNERTLLAYHEYAEQYLAQTPTIYSRDHSPLIKWVDASLSLAPGKKIFEIGSGHGRDARHITNRGYDLMCSDATQAFVDHLKSIGLNAIQLNVLKDTMPRDFDMVFANSVFPHFTDNDLDVVLQKTYQSLNPKGILAFSLKQGTGEKWVNEKLDEKRYVRYRQPDEIIETILSHGYHIELLERDLRGGDIKSHVWMHLTVRKSASDKG